MPDVGRKIIDRIEARRVATAARAAELAAMPNKPSLLSRTLGRAHQGIVRFEPYGIILAVVGLILTFGTIVLDLEDQQSERIFKGWEILALDHETVNNSSAKRQALEFLNREYDGGFCDDVFVPWLIANLNGNASRRCLIPAKAREEFPRLVAEGTKLEFLNLPRGFLRKARLKEANLYGANLFRAHLFEADLKLAVLTKAVLTRANLVGANLEEASLKEAILAGAFMMGANLGRANLEKASLEEAILQGANLEGAYLFRATLDRAALHGAVLSDAVLTGAYLRGAVLSDAVLQGAVLTGAYLSKAHLNGVIGLTQGQLDLACGVPASLPQGLTPPGPCPTGGPGTL